MMKYKIRLVAKKYSQVVGIVFNEIFVLIVKFTTIKISAVIEAIMDLKMLQIDKFLKYKITRRHLYRLFLNIFITRQ